MRDAAIARRFAKAFIAAAVEAQAKSVEKYGQELEAASSAFKAGPELYKILLNPMYKLTERKALLDKVSGALGLSSPVARLLSILV
ncbi:MAG: F0F1 ATP synthase subunit delta, partial [Deltaproteobacteria bacterium]